MKSAVVNRLGLLSSLVPLLAACGADKEFEPAPPFNHVEDVQVWANSASAVGVYVHAYKPIGAADGQPMFPDPLCPATSDDGTTLTITGGCTDAEENEWTGTATVVRDGDDRTLTLDGFGGDDGSVTLRRLDATTHEFEAEFVSGGVTTISYTGTVEGGYTGPTRWNGSGTVSRDGVLPPNGSVEATTADQLVDNVVCAGQAVSGSTTLHARGDTAVVTYDGATDCDADQNARLSVNGKDRGLISGISCSLAAPGAKGAAGLPAGALVLAAFFVRLRRRQRNA
jgi:hypothetical protein